MRLLCQLIAFLLLLAAPAGATSTTVTYPVHVNPAITFSGSTSFRSPNLGVPSSSRAPLITLTNTGSAVLPFTSVSIVGANAADFALSSSTCVSPLNPATSCQVAVTYTASALAVETATLQMVGTSGHTYSLALSGTTSAPISIKLFPSSVTEQVGASGGVVVSTASVTTFDGSPYAGTLSISNGPSFLTISGLSVVMSRTLQGMDVGTYAPVIIAN